MSNISKEELIDFLTDKNQTTYDENYLPIRSYPYTFILWSEIYQDVPWYRVYEILYALKRVNYFPKN